jgi:hypothetical protein
MLHGTALEQQSNVPCGGGVKLGMEAVATWHCVHVPVPKKLPTAEPTAAQHQRSCSCRGNVTASVEPVGATPPAGLELRLSGWTVND